MKNKFILIICILILCVIGTVVYFTYDKKDNPTNENTTITPNIPKNNENIANFEDITNLPEAYQKEQAIEDNFLVIVHDKCYNQYLYDEFIKSLNENSDASLKIMMYTIEGDPILTKIIYVAKENKFYACKDNTRDEFSNQEDRIYSYYEFNELKFSNFSDNSQNIYFINEEGNDVFLFYIP